MLYQLRTGDIILCENKKANQTNVYFNSQCKLAFPVKAHDGFHDLNIVIELGE